jgi:hypothetical protein
MQWKCSGLTSLAAVSPAANSRSLYDGPLCSKPWLPTQHPVRARHRATTCRARGAIVTRTIAADGLTFFAALT